MALIRQKLYLRRCLTVYKDVRFKPKGKGHIMEGQLPTTNDLSRKEFTQGDVVD